MENQVDTKGIRIVGAYFLSATGEKEPFRCSLCGKLLMVHNATLEGIDFVAPNVSTTFAVDVLCTRCKIIYRVVSSHK